MAATRQSILAATDLSTKGNHAVERAAVLAAQKGIDAIRVLHVIEQHPVLRAQPMLDGIVDRIARETGVRLEPQVKAGRPLQVIAEASQQFGLLVVGASTDRPLRDLLIGSTAERLMSRTPASILAVRRRPDGPYRQALVAVDFSGFDDNVLSCARLLAPQARLDLMHVFDTRLEGKMRYAGVDPEVIAEYRSSRRDAAMREMRAFVERVTGRFRTVVVNGHIPSSLLHEGRKLNADLIVVGHPRKGWLSNLVLRRTAAEMVPNAHTDILVVH